MTKVKDLGNYKHPNSRKTRALQRQIKKTNVKEKRKQLANIKNNVIGEKLLWFQENLADSNQCTAQDVEELIKKYLSRFDEELDQINIKHSIGGRKNRQHANREDVIKLTLNRELEDYKTCGLEIPDLLNPAQFIMLKTWNGELRYLTNFKLKRYSEKFLQEEIMKMKA